MPTRWCMVQIRRRSRIGRCRAKRGRPEPQCYQLKIAISGERRYEGQEQTNSAPRKRKLVLKEISMSVDTILHNAKIATNGVPSFVEALAVSGGKITATGTDDEVLRLRGPETRVIDGKRRTVIPGLNDSHMHPIRGGVHYKLELRWDG